MKVKFLTLAVFGTAIGGAPAGAQLSIDPISPWPATCPPRCTGAPRAPSGGQFLHRSPNFLHQYRVAPPPPHRPRDPPSHITPPVPRPNPVRPARPTEPGNATQPTADQLATDRLNEGSLEAIRRGQVFRSQQPSR